MSFFFKLFKNTETIETPQPTVVDNFSETEGVLLVEDIFSIMGKGVVLSGKVLSGGITVGFSHPDGVEVRGIEQFNKGFNTAMQGDQVGVLINLKDKELAQIFVEENNNQVKFNKA
ncbi:MAG TPA: hypothetical protein DEB09_03805 [Candidatus Magasanikbacteria bacterium]|nr:hypothetical protein [Candidatus Magasanikbacteria bacterium]